MSVTAEIGEGSAFLEPIMPHGAFLTVGRSCAIGAGVTFGDFVTVQDAVTIGANSSIGHRVTFRSGAQVESGAHIESGVVIGPRARIGKDALILNGAQVSPHDVTSMSSNARQLEHAVTIGKGVLLDDEVELGAYAVVPTQRTIAAIGKFGDKNRVVTIYGSSDGPRYSIGCQMGMPFGIISQRVKDSENTNDGSAMTYRPFLDIFSQVGLVVQKAYDNEANYVAELMEMRRVLGMEY